MKWIVAAVVCIAANGFSASPQNTSGEKENLGLTTRILEVRYCDSGYEDMALLKMSLQLTYLNSGKRPLILYRWTPLPDYVLVSLNRGECHKHRIRMESAHWVDNCAIIKDG